MKLLGSLLGILFISTSLLASNEKIIGGDIPPEDHPGFFNTVALIKKADHKIFCTGSIATKRLIITAKHCLAGKKLEDFDIFFGPSTLDLDSGVVISPKRFQVRYPTDWEVSFPSGDIAWIELEAEIPTFAKPLRILSDSSKLPVGGTFVLAGYGNKNPTGSIEAGEKFFSLTRLSRYHNNPRFMDVMVFKGDQGQGACHGDSGGPAYVRLTNEAGNLEWFLVGVTNGFDLILTPNSMSRTNDPDFPFHVDCSQNENLYTFIGGHGKWIEDTSGIILDSPKEFEQRDWEPQNQAQNLHAWCEAKDLGSPEWNTLKMILDQKVDTLRGEAAKEFYLNCDNVVSYLEGLDEVHFDGDKMLVATYGLRNLSLLPNLKRIYFSRVKEQKLLLDSMESLNLELLSFYESPLADLSFLNPSLQIKRLEINRSELKSLVGVENLDHLVGIGLSFNSLTSIESLRKFSDLKELALDGSDLQDYSLVAKLKALEILDLRSSSFNNFKLIKDLNSLRELSLGYQDLGMLDFRQLTSLEKLALTHMKFKTIQFGKLDQLRYLEITNSQLQDISELSGMKSLEVATLSFNELSDIGALSGLTNLKSVNLSANPIKDLAPLRTAGYLEVLRVFQTPLAKGEVTKTPENCPVDASEVLRKFCSR